MKNRKNREEETRIRPPNPVSLDNMIASYDPQGSYGEPVLNPPDYREKDLTLKNLIILESQDIWEEYKVVDTFLASVQSN